MADNKLMLIDGNSILNRAYYGLQGNKLLQTSEGLYTNAIYGFLNILNMYLGEEEPNYLCVAFDMKGKTFRHEKFDGYKAQRKGMPDELAQQLPVVKEVLDAMRISRLEYGGFEADDIIGSVSKCAEDLGMDVIIVTGDKDSLQLASNKVRIKMPVTRKGSTETMEYDRCKIIEKYHIQPFQFIDVKGLMGDSSDNIPGVRGIGEKTALKLIKEYGSLEGIYENIGKISASGLKTKLMEGKDLAFLSRKLGTIDREMPELCKIKDLKRTEFDKEALLSVFKRLEFKSFIEKYGLEGHGSMEKIIKEVECITEPKRLSEILDDIKRCNNVTILPLYSNTNAACISGIALAWNESSVYIHMEEINADFMFLSILKDLLEDEKIKKIGHNIKHFIVYLKKMNIKLEGLEYDLMISAYLIDSSGQDYSICSLAKKYLQIDMDSMDAICGTGRKRISYFEIPPQKKASIMGVQAEIVSRLRRVIDEELDKNGQAALFCNIEMPLIEVLADMEYCGFKVDGEVLKEFSCEMDEKLGDITERIYRYAGEKFNLNSPKQLGEILFNKLKLPVVKKTKTGYSTSAEVLEKLSGKHEIVNSILEYRQMMKLKSTYIEGLLNVIDDETGKVYTSFNQTSVVTGRISSTEPNLQNIPVKMEAGRKIRKAFVPSGDEYVLADADYSQIELRVLAHISGDKNMIEAFGNNEDIHTATAAQIFGIGKDEVTKAMRGNAKAVNFGIVYGIGDFSLSQDIGITRKEAKKYIEGYLNKYYGVKEYMVKVIEEGRDKGYVQTLFKRRRYLPELKAGNFNIRSFGERIALNMPVQGSAADIIKIAMINIYKEFKKRNMKSRILLQVHDELLVEAHKKEIKEVENIMRHCMEHAVELDVPLRVDFKSGNSWYDTK